MTRRFNIGYIMLLLSGVLIFQSPFHSHVYAGNSIFVQGGISGDDPGDNSSQGDAISAQAKFEIDYSGEPLQPAGSGGNPSAVAPKIREILRQVGLLYYKGNYENALSRLREAEAVDPTSYEVLCARAAILSESGDIAGARKIYTQLAQAHPKLFTPRYDLAELLLMEKKYDAAREAFQQLLMQFPNCDLARFKILLTCLVQNNGELADESVADLKQREPSAVLYYALSAVAFSNGDIAGGKKWIASAEGDFGAGRHRVLYDSLADLGFVIHNEYPPKK